MNDHWSVAADAAAESWTLEDAIEFAQGGGSPTISEKVAARLRVELEKLREQRAFYDVLPKHNCSLELAHNPQKPYCMTVAQWAEENDEHWTWVSPMARERAIEHDELWTLSVHDLSSVGHYDFCGPDLEELLDVGRRVSRAK